MRKNDLLFLIIFIINIFALSNGIGQIYNTNDKPSESNVKNQNLPVSNTNFTKPLINNTSINNSVQNTDNNTNNNLFQKSGTSAGITSSTSYTAGDSVKVDYGALNNTVKSGSYDVKQYDELSSTPVGSYVYPTSMAFSPIDRLWYIVGTGSHVYKFDTDMNYIGQFGSFTYAQRISINNTGYIYILDFGTNYTSIYNPSNEYVGNFSLYRGETGGQGGMAINSTGYIYTAELGGTVGSINDYHLEIYSPTGSHLNEFNTLACSTVQVSDVMDLVLSHDDQSYYSLCRNNEGGGLADYNIVIRQNAFTGTNISWYQNSGGSSGDFQYPNKMSIDSAGNIYISRQWTLSTVNNIIMIFDYNLTSYRYFITHSTYDVRVLGIDDNDNLYYCHVVLYKMYKLGLYTVSSNSVTDWSGTSQDDYTSWTRKISHTTNSYSVFYENSFTFQFYDMNDPSILGLKFSWNVGGYQLFQNQYLTNTLQGIYGSGELSMTVDFKFLQPNASVKINIFDTNNNSIVTKEVLSQNIANTNYSLIENDWSELISLNYIWAESIGYNSNGRSQVRYTGTSDILEHTLDIQVFEYRRSFTVYAPIGWNYSYITPSATVTLTSDNYVITGTIPVTYTIHFLSGTGYGRDYTRKEKVLAIQDNTTDLFNCVGFEKCWSNDFENSAYPFTSIGLNQTYSFEGVSSLKLYASTTGTYAIRNTPNLLANGEYYLTFDYYVQSFSGTAFKLDAYEGSWKTHDSLNTSVTNRWISYSTFLKIDGSQSNYNLQWWFQSASGTIFLDNIRLFTVSTQTKSVGTNNLQITSQLNYLNDYYLIAGRNLNTSISLVDRTAQTVLFNTYVISDSTGYISYNFKGYLDKREYSIYVLALVSNWYNSLDLSQIGQYEYFRDYLSTPMNFDSGTSGWVADGSVSVSQYNGELKAITTGSSYTGVKYVFSNTMSKNIFNTISFDLYCNSSVQMYIYLYYTTIYTKARIGFTCSTTKTHYSFEISSFELDANYDTEPNIFNTLNIQVGVTSDITFYTDNIQLLGYNNYPTKNLGVNWGFDNSIEYFFDNTGVNENFSDSTSMNWYNGSSTSGLANELVQNTAEGNQTEYFANILGTPMTFDSSTEGWQPYSFDTLSVESGKLKLNGTIYNGQIFYFPNNLSNRVWNNISFDMYCVNSSLIMSLYFLYYVNGAQLGDRVTQFACPTTLTHFSYTIQDIPIHSGYYPETENFNGMSFVINGNQNQVYYTDNIQLFGSNDYATFDSNIHTTWDFGTSNEYFYNTYQNISDFSDSTTEGYNNTGYGILSNSNSKYLHYTNASDYFTTELNNQSNFNDGSTEGFTDWSGMGQCISNYNNDELNVTTCSSILSGYIVLYHNGLSVDTSKYRYLSFHYRITGGTNTVDNIDVYKGNPFSTDVCNVIQFMTTEETFTCDLGLNSGWSGTVTSLSIVLTMNVGSASASDGVLFDYVYLSNKPDYIQTDNNFTTGQGTFFRTGLSITSSTYRYLGFEFNTTYPIDNFTIYDGTNQVCFDSTGWSNGWYYFSCDLGLDADWSGTETTLNITFGTSSNSIDLFFNIIGIYDSVKGDVQTWSSLGNSSAMYNYVNPSGFINVKFRTTTTTSTSYLYAGGLHIDTSIYRYITIRIKSNNNGWFDFYSLGKSAYFPYYQVTPNTWETFTFDIFQTGYSGIFTNLAVYFRGTGGSGSQVAVGDEWYIDYILITADNITSPSGNSILYSYNVGTKTSIAKSGMSIDSSVYSYLGIEFYSKNQLTSISVSNSSGTVLCSSSTGWSENTWNFLSCHITSSYWSGTQTYLNITFVNGTTSAQLVFIQRIYLYDSDKGDTLTFAPTNAEHYLYVNPEGYLSDKITGTNSMTVWNPSVSIDSSIYRYVKIKIQSDKDNSFMVRFISSSVNYYSTIYATTSSWNTYTIDLSAVTGWSGTITSFGLYWRDTGGGSIPTKNTTFNIAYIILIADNISNTLSTTDLFTESITGWVGSNSISLVSGCIVNNCIEIPSSSGSAFYPEYYFNQSIDLSNIEYISFFTKSNINLQITEVYLYTDSSDYYYITGTWNIFQDWNKIIIVFSDMSSSGSPDLSDITSFKIKHVTANANLFIDLLTFSISNQKKYFNSFLVTDEIGVSWDFSEGNLEGFTSYSYQTIQNGYYEEIAYGSYGTRIYYKTVSSINAIYYNNFEMRFKTNNTNSNPIFYFYQDANNYYWCYLTNIMTKPNNTFLDWNIDLSSNTCNKKGSVNTVTSIYAWTGQANYYHDFVFDYLRFVHRDSDIKIGYDYEFSQDNYFNGFSNDGSSYLINEVKSGFYARSLSGSSSPYLWIATPSLTIDTSYYNKLEVKAKTNNITREILAYILGNSPLSYYSFTTADTWQTFTWDISSNTWLNNVLRIYLDDSGTHAGSISSGDELDIAYVKLIHTDSSSIIKKGSNDFTINTEENYYVNVWLDTVNIGQTQSYQKIGLNTSYGIHTIKYQFYSLVSTSGTYLESAIYEYTYVIYETYSANINTFILSSDFISIYYTINKESNVYVYENDSLVTSKLNTFQDNLKWSRNVDVNNIQVGIKLINAVNSSEYKWFNTSYSNNLVITVTNLAFYTNLTSVIIEWSTVVSGVSVIVKEDSSSIGTYSTSPIVFNKSEVVGDHFVSVQFTKANYVSSAFSFTYSVSSFSISYSVFTINDTSVIYRFSSSSSGVTAYLYEDSTLKANGTKDSDIVFDKNVNIGLHYVSVIFTKTYNDNITFAFSYTVNQFSIFNTLFYTNSSSVIFTFQSDYSGVNAYLYEGTSLEATGTQNSNIVYNKTDTEGQHLVIITFVKTGHNNLTLSNTYTILPLELTTFNYLINRTNIYIAVNTSVSVNILVYHDYNLTASYNGTTGQIITITKIAEVGDHNVIIFINKTGFQSIIRQITYHIDQVDVININSPDYYLTQTSTQVNVDNSGITINNILIIIFMIFFALVSAVGYLRSLQREQPRFEGKAQSLVVGTEAKLEKTLTNATNKGVKKTNELASKKLQRKGL